MPPAKHIGTTARNHSFLLFPSICSMQQHNFSEKNQRIEESHMMPQPDFKVLKWLIFFPGFLRPVLLGSIPEPPSDPVPHPALLLPPAPLRPGSVNSFVPNSVVLCVSEGPWCSCEVSMTNSGNAGRVFLMSTKPLCHRIVARGAKFHLGIRRGCFFFLFSKRKLGRRKGMEGQSLPSSN